MQPSPSVPRWLGWLVAGAMLGCGTDAGTQATDSAALEDVDPVDVHLDVPPSDLGGGQTDLGGQDAGDTNLGAGDADGPEADGAPAGDVADGVDAAEVVDVGEPDTVDASDETADETAGDAEIVEDADAVEVADDAELAETIDAEGDADVSDGVGGDADTEDADSAAPPADIAGDATATGLPATATIIDIDALPAPQPGPFDPTKLPPAPFADVSADFGFDPYTVHGACVGVGDFDNDDDDDFLVIQVNKTKATIHAVLLGPQGPQHVYTPFDTTLLLPTTGCSMADMNNDGKLDLLVGGHAGAALYLGDGKGGFADASAAWLPYIMDFATLTIAPVDLDGDGDLDIMVGAGITPVTADGGGPPCGTIVCDYQQNDFICKLQYPFPESPASLQDRVLIQGANLPMSDETTAWQVPPGGIWSNVLPLDVDMDGKMDILVGDDFGTHRLLHNVGGKFANYTTDIGFHSYGHAMGWGVGDFDANGKPDLIMADAGPTPLYLQRPAKSGLPALFEDIGNVIGVWAPSWTASSWSPVVADFDQDGMDDIMLGVSISTTLSAFPPTAAGCYGQPGKPYDGHPNVDVLFLSQGGLPMTAYHFPTGPYSHFALVTQVPLDLDGDGDLDLVQTRPNVGMTSAVRIVRNDIPIKGNWFRVRLTGKKGNMDAVGARVTANIGGVLRTRWLVGTGGTGGTRLRLAHFGLAGASIATDVTVHWPDGTKTVLGTVAAGATAKATWP
ncbi:MAG: hypothetical protein RIT45_2470 [Pseudomonadota bacterium]